MRSGTPAPVLARLRADFERVMSAPETAATLEKRGARPLHIAAHEADATLASDIDKWTRLIREAGLTAD